MGFVILFPAMMTTPSLTTQRRRNNNGQPLRQRRRRRRRIPMMFPIAIVQLLIACLILSDVIVTPVSSTSSTFRPSPSRHTSTRIVHNRKPLSSLSRYASSPLLSSRLSTEEGSRSSISSSSSAFIFSVLKRRRKNNSEDDDVVAVAGPASPPQQQEPRAIMVDKIANNVDANVNGHTNIIKNNGTPKVKVNGSNNGSNTNGNHTEYHNEYKLGGEDQHTNDHEQQQQQQQTIEAMQNDQPLLDTIDVVEDEPYAATTMHPIQKAYTKLSKKPSSLPTSTAVEENSLDSMEGKDDNVNFVRASYYNENSPKEEKKNDDKKEGSAEKKLEESFKEKVITTVGANDKEKGEEDDESSSDMWAKRNARSIDEGIRFKSQLREGLEEQTKLHREKLLSNLLEGVIGGTTSAFEIETEKIKNATSRFRWLGFGRGNNKDSSEVEGEVVGGESAQVGNTTADIGSSSATLPNANDEAANDATSSSQYNEVTIDTSTTTTTKLEKHSKSRKFVTRLISGLIMALAEEAEGLEVTVDADPDTPISDKTIHSIKIYFSRLGFRQIRMGGLDDAFNDLETSMSMAEKFALAKSFFNLGKNKKVTADEAFDKMDVDGSGGLDEEELAQALTMAALIGGGGGGGSSSRFGVRSKEALTELASRLVRLYDADGDGVVDREEYQAMVHDMASLKDAKLKEEKANNNEHTNAELKKGRNDKGGEKKKGAWLSSVFRGKTNGDGDSSSENNSTTIVNGNEVVDVTEDETFWRSFDNGEGSIVFEDLKLDLRRLLFGVIPGAKKVLPGGPLILKPFTATATVSFTSDDIMDSILLDTGLRRLVARALSRRVRGLRDLLDGAVFYGRTWKVFEQNSPQVEVAKFEDVQFDKRNRLIITGRAKITDGNMDEPIEQGFKVRTKIGTRANGRIIGLLEPEIAIFAECPKDLEKTVRTQCKKWFDYTIPTIKPLYAYIPLVSPLKKNDKMDGFNMGEDNQMKSIEIKDGKIYIQFCAFLRPGRFLGNHYLAFTVPNRTLILTLDRVREGMRIGRRNKRLAELAAREVKQLAAAQGESGGDGEQATQSNSGKPYISEEGKVRIKRLEKELKATIQEEAILLEMKEFENKNGKTFIGRFVAGYLGAIREELDLEMNARLSSSISNFFGSQDREGEDEEP